MTEHSLARSAGGPRWRWLWHRQIKKPFFGRFMKTWRWPADVSQSGWERVRIASRSHSLLYAIVAHTELAPRGVVVCAHPMGLASKGFWLRHGHAARLLASGFHVVAFDFNGFGESPSTNFDFPGDVLAVGQWARQRFDGLPVHALTASFGALNTLSAIDCSDFPFDKVVAESCPPSLPDFWKAYPVAHAVLQVGRLLNPAVERHLRPVEHLARMREGVAVLLIHSQADSWTSVDAGTALHKAASRPESIQRLVLVRADHTHGLRDEPERYWGAVQAFLASTPQPLPEGMSSMFRYPVKKVAVLGAGVMGAQIAAHLVNVRVPVVLFDLPAKEGPKNGIVTRAVDNLGKLKPSPLGVSKDAELIEQANYEDDLDRLGECDLVIEAIAERMDWKLDLYKKIAPHVAPHAILASNTSGLSITQLSKALPDALKPRFCGIHFFNPPRYMFLVELINTPTTEPKVLDDLEAFVTSVLGKGVVRAKDTPNFIANRVGIAGMLATLKEVEKFGLTPDVVDDLTGKKLGRASSGTFRTADVVGLDTLAHVVKTLQDTLDEKSDPFYANFATPPVLAKLIEKGHLGQKTQAGFYKKLGRDILRFDLQKGEYVPGGAMADEVYGRMLKKPAAQRLKLLRESEGPQGQFLWAILRDSFHYAAVHLGSIAESARDVDFAMRWGFGMQQGPFELWQDAGWTQVATWIQEDIDAGKALSKAPLPSWVFEGPVAQAGGVHTPEGSWSAAESRFVPLRRLPVHARQLFAESVLGAKALQAEAAGTTLSDEGDVRVWTLDGEVLIASIHSKMNAISPDVAEALAEAVALAEKNYKGLVIWSPDDKFSVGADLQAMLPAFVVAGIGAVESAEKALQEVMLRIRYAGVPVVSAVRGLALGGGCELAIHSAARVVAMESYIGLVEVGVGLIPGAGGLTCIARRAAERAEASTGNDLLPFLTEGFTAAAMAKVGTSALESRQLGYLLDSDVIVPNKDELLYVALQQVKAMSETGWRAPMKRKFKVAGRSGAATIKGQLVNMRDGGFISAHDFHIAGLIAGVLTGGDVDAGTLVSEEYLMTLERKAFCSLILNPKTQERIMGMLSTGKPVRN